VQGVELPLEPDRLARLPWLAQSSFYRDEITLTHVDSGATAQLAFQPRIYSDNLYALRSAAVLGLGVAVLSLWAVREELARGELVAIAPDWAAQPLPVDLVYPPARFYPARLRRFIDIMKVAVPQAFGITKA
jgi:DNA-binding transcriptional LysR family regulator